MNYQNIINKALELGLKEVEIFARESYKSSLELFKGKLETFNVSNIEGISIRGLNNGKMGYVYTENFEESAIDEVLAKLLQNTLNLTQSNPEFIFDGNAEYQKVEELTADFDNYSVDEKVALLKKLEKDIYDADERFNNVQTRFSENRTVTRIINSKGMNLEKHEEYMLLVAMANATQGDQTQTSFGFNVATKFEELNTKEVFDEVLKVLDSLGAGFVKSGTYPVVLSREVASDILTAFSSVFSGMSALRKLSILVGKENTQVFGNNITIVDNPFAEKALAKVSFDDEGVPCRFKHVVENGIFRGFLHNQQSANFFKLESTGNGFKNATSASVGVMPTSLYIEEGNKTKDEIISTVENGIYVTDVAGLHAGINPISGDFNVQSSGFMIENGKLSKPITLFVISGNFFSMLNEVEEIGNDIKKNFDGVVSPTLKVKSLSVSGK